MQWLSATPPAQGEAGRSAPSSLPATASASAPQLARLERSQARLDQRVAQLQGDLEAERRLGEARQRELAKLRSQLAQNRAGTPWWWNAALGGLGALAALLGLLLWQRRDVRTQSPWHAELPTAASRAAERTLLSELPPVEPPSTFPPQPLQLRPSGFQPSAFQRPLSAPEQVQIDEVVDHGHLADFFIGIGEYDKAIDVMRRALAESGGGLSVMPYLYLFDLYRRAGRREDYEALLADCGSRLNVRIPEWDEAPSQAQEQRDLLDYPRALALLSSVWGTPACLTVIERMIADDPRKPRVGFDLPAYRDLLDLYGLARELRRAAPAPQPQVPPQGQQQPATASLPALDLELSLPAGVDGDEAPDTLQPLDFSLQTQPPR